VSAGQGRASDDSAGKGPEEGEARGEGAEDATVALTPLFSTGGASPWYGQSSEPRLMLRREAERASIVNGNGRTGGRMARNPVRDERQGDLFGAPPPRAKPARRAASPVRVADEAPAWETASLAALGQRVTRAEIDDLLDGLPDEELAYLVVKAVRAVKRRIAQEQGRVLRPKGAGRGKSPLEDALQRVGGELMEFDDPGETW
jgi:hypothetical protein